MSDEVKVIVFDFDGVLVDSVKLKHNALKDNFIEFGETFAKDVFDHHLKYGDTRYQSAEYAKSKLTDANEDFVEKYVKKYTKNVKDKILKMSLNKGGDAVLLDLVKRFPLYISSGTPEVELNDILRKKTMSHIFQGIYGSPDSKEEHLRKIIEAEHVDPKNILFIGDMHTDYEAAKNMGCQFLGINIDTTTIEDSIETIEELMDILEFVKKRNTEGLW